MQRWADDELRSVNAQIEYVLRQALVEAGRVKLVEKVQIQVEDAVDGSDDWMQIQKDTIFYKNQVVALPDLEQTGLYIK